ncbi:MAG TPA: hemolysin family protein [bacterium]|nr:hemolysin family protein [bacterium]
MTETTLYLIGIAFCLLCEAFFAGSEMGIVSLNKIRLKHLADEGNRSALLILKMLEHPEKVLGTTLVAVNLAIVASASMASYVTALHFRQSTELLTTAIMLPLIVVFGELIPKMIFRRHADRLTLLSVHGLRLAYFILFPMVTLCSGIGKGLAQVVGAGGEEKNPYVSREELILLVQEQARKGTSKRQYEMAHQAFYFGETLARNIMVPLIEVKAVDAKAGVAEIRRIVLECGFSHIPVYEERIDNIVGMIEMFDLLQARDTQTAREIMQEPVLVPDTLSIATLLDTLRARRANIAILIDEYGGVSGIATTEDIMEEIVGDIRDEYDLEERSEIIREKHSLVVDGKVTIDRLNEDFGMKLPKEGVETVAGFLVSQFGALPSAGRKLAYRRLEFEVLEASSRAIQRVRIRKR